MVRFHLARPLRLAWASLGTVGVASAVFLYGRLATGPAGPAEHPTNWVALVLLSLLALGAGLVLTWLPYVEVRGPSALVIHGFATSTVVPWTSIRAVEAELTSGGCHLVVHTAHGIYHPMAPRWSSFGGMTRPGRDRMGFDVALSTIWTTWQACMGPDAAAKPWRVPEADVSLPVTFRSVGAQWFMLGRGGLVLFWLLTNWLIVLVLQGELLSWPVGVLLLVVAGLVRRVRVTVDPVGVTVCRLGTVVTPWSAVGAITVGHVERLNGPRVQLLTVTGPVWLPLPFTGSYGRDPRFWHKYELIHRTWEANRGPDWVGRPPPPLRPDPPLPPPPRAG
jgi:hypothetical protein